MLSLKIRTSRKFFRNFKILSDHFNSTPDDSKLFINFQAKTIKLYKVANCINNNK